MLPRELFENQTGEQQVATESDVFYLVDRVETDKGIRAYLKGAEYYQKGQAPAQTLFFLNMAKRIVVESLKLTSKLPVVCGILAGQAISPKKHKLSIQGILGIYNSILWKVISPYILKMENMIEMPQEIRKFSYVFLKELGISDDVARQFSAIFSHFFEYDNAYRYRVQDLLNEITEEELKTKPIKTLNKLIQINKERDATGVSEKFKSGIRLIQVALLIPKYRKAFIKAFDFIEFKKLQFDEIDMYWICMRSDYLYLGEDLPTRAKRNEGKSIPAPMPKAEYEEYVKGLQAKNNDMMILRSIDVLLNNEKYKKIIKDKLKK